VSGDEAGENRAQRINRELIELQGELRVALPGVQFRARDKENLLRRSNVSALAGLVLLAFAIASAILLVVDVLFDRTRAWAATAAVGGVLVTWWLAVPFVQRSRVSLDQPPPTQAPGHGSD
jgi:uncharacterized membrane protein YqjE